MENIVYELVSSPYGVDNLKATLPNGVELWIPQDPNNADYQRYLEQLEESD
jgi:hypothetical protein